MQWVKLCKAFLVEAEWLSSGHLPSAEKYLRNGIVTTGVNTILVHAFFLLGQQISNRTVEVLDDDSDIVLSSSMILRLWDDMGNAKVKLTQPRLLITIRYWIRKFSYPLITARYKIEILLQFL